MADGVTGSVLARIAPAVWAVFLCFAGIGATISIIPIYLDVHLGCSTLVVGSIVASQYAAMLLARPAAGRAADRFGPKVALWRGMLLFLLCGVGYLCSAEAGAIPAKLGLLVAARVILGIAESYIVTGALAWAIRHVGAAHAGMVMSWNGNAMYGGIAIGAPLAGLLSGFGGFEAVAWASILLACGGAAIVAAMPGYDPSGAERAPFHQTLGFVAEPGLGLLSASVGYGMILGFATLFFQRNGWSSSFFAVFGFGAAYVAARVFLGGLPDKHGGVRIALWSLAVEAAGQSLLYFGRDEYGALLGVVLSGAGFSLVVPSFGVEAVRRVPQQNRGSAMAGYLAFFDLAFGLAIPLAGLVADSYSLQAVYLLGLIGALAGLGIALRMKPTPAVA